MNDPNINEEVYEGFMNAAWQIIERECMYTSWALFIPLPFNRVVSEEPFLMFFFL